MAHRTTPRPRAPTALLRARFARPVLEVLRVLDAAGHRSWLVGGTVRDVLLRRGGTGTDLDVATPARPDQVARLFPKVIPTGAEHGTVTVLAQGRPVEVTTFRGEGAYEDARRPSSVTFLDDIDEDLARRDFTVNALAWDPIGKEFRDPFGGRADLRARLLRAVGDPAARFAEDGLRPVRAARFAAQLGFRVEATTAAAIPGAAASTARVSVERTTEELSRLVLAPHARRGLDLLDATGLLSILLPDLAALGTIARRHAFDVAEAVPRDLALRMAALLHVLAQGQPAAAAGLRVRDVLSGMRFSGHARDAAAAAVAEHGCLVAAGRAPLPGSGAEVRRWLSRLGGARAPSVLALWRADAQALRPAARSRRERAALRAFATRVRRVERAGPPLAPSELALDGRAVMEVLRLPPGPDVGEALRHLLDRVLDDPALNTRPRLTSELRAWWSSRGSPG